MTQIPANSAKPTGDTDLSGRQIGDFHVLRRLGRGAMAEVYLAEQRSLRRQVALKVLRRDLAADDTYVRRFHNEAQAAAALVHAGIVQIYDVGCSDGVHYIAQEYVQGQNLREYLQRHGPLDVRLAVAIMRQVAAALHKAAERGIVHRDIKPENIMLARSAEVKVADFGLARVAGDAAAVGLTQVGVTMGTPLYMSPEQVEGRPLDPRSDIYSFGVTCYHMLAGKPPFEGDTPLAVALQHLRNQPPPLAQLRPDLPVALCRIVHKMMAKDPAERYATPRELARDLRALPVQLDADDGEAALDEIDVDLGALPELRQVTRRLDELMKTSTLVAQRRRRSTRWIVAAAAASLLVGMGLNWYFREPFLLAGSIATSIDRQESAGAQLFVAKLQTTNREAWLKSVEHYFPQDEEAVVEAKRELARLYLQDNRLDEALPAFEELAQRYGSRRSTRAFGLAGQYVVSFMQKDVERAGQVLAALAPLRDDLTDRRLSWLVSNTLEAHRKALDQQTAREWDEWIKTLPQQEDDSSGG